MSLAWTYTTLKTAVKNHVDGDTSSTGGLADVTNLDNLIKAAEERILTELPLTLFDTEATITLTINTVTVAKPTGYLAWRYANFTNASSVKVPLDLRTLEYLEDYNPNPATTGTPKFLADYDSTTWKVAPTPSSTVTGKALYVKRPTSIVDGATSWLGTNAGLLLFRACLANSEKFIKNDKRVALWEADYKETLAASYTEFRHLIRPDFSRLAAMPAPK